MMKELEIRLIAEADVDGLTELEKMSFDDPWSKESFQNELTNPMARYWGVFYRQQLIAYIGYWLIIDEAHITNVAVDPIFRGQGVGETLVKFAMNACQIENVFKLTLEVRKSNFIAQRLYAKLGFESFGERPNYYNDGESAIIMWADISNE